MSGTNGELPVDDVVGQMRSAHTQCLKMCMAMISRQIDVYPEGFRRMAHLVDEAGVNEVRHCNNDELTVLQSLAQLGFIHAMNERHKGGMDKTVIIPPS